MKNIVLAFIKKEFAQTLRDPVMRVFLLVAPVLQLVVLGYAISTDFRNLRVAVQYEPSDVAARQLADKIYSTEWFVRVEAFNRDPYELLQSGKADAVLVAPLGGMTRALANGGESAQLLIDAQNATKARAVEAYLQTILAAFVKEKYPAARQGGAVNFDIRVLYNPAMETSLFMIPAIMALIMALATVMLTSMSIAREKELGTFESIIAAPLTNTEIILGKTIPFIIIGFFDAIFIIAVGTGVFGMPMRGPVLLLALATVVFVCATVSIGTLISTIAKNQQQAMMGTFLFLFPSILMSGMMFPVENMPAALRVFAYLNPVKYFITILRNVMLKGNIPELYWPNLAVLLAMTLVVVFVAAKRFRQTLN